LRKGVTDKTTDKKHAKEKGNSKKKCGDHFWPKEKACGAEKKEKGWRGHVETGNAWGKGKERHFKIQKQRPTENVAQQRRGENHFPGKTYARGTRYHQLGKKEKGRDSWGGLKGEGTKLFRVWGLWTPCGQTQRKVCHLKETDREIQKREVA